MNKLQDNITTNMPESNTTVQPPTTSEDKLFNREIIDLLTTIQADTKSIKNDNKHIRSDLSSFKDKITYEINSIKDHQSELTASQALINDQFESNKKLTNGLLKKHVELERNINQLIIDVTFLLKENESRKMEINNQENRNRKWSTEINGIPYNPNEDCYELVEKIGKLILPDFNKNKIDICHRNKQAPNATTPPTITCLFKNRTDRDIFFVNRKSLKDKSINDIGLKATPATDTTRNKIFINESLSAITKSFRQA